jgi:hypothetical protein
MSINTKVSKADHDIILKIVQRATEEDLLFFDGLSLDMDLCATHNQIPLRLSKLLHADAFNFAHDIAGIQRHMDRTTGKLTGSFLPRFARTTRRHT